MQQEKGWPSLRKAAFMALALLLIFIAAWELYWRTNGFIPTYNDDKSLWADKRKEVYSRPGTTTVFIGSSRIKFDVDLREWKALTGEDAIQLALVGTSPRLLLKDLADDQRFKGKLVIDVTEPMFFSNAPHFHASAKEAIGHYTRQTPAEKASAVLQFGLESRFAFLEEGQFSLTKLLESIEIPNRPGVFALPPFPKGFEWTTRDRQTYMSSMFLNDPAAVKKQTDIWKLLIMGNKNPPASGKELDSIFQEVNNNIRKITSRGGRVLFVRTPSSGPLGMGEQLHFPRTKYWEPLLRTTGMPGFHFMDDSITAKMICPEWSHLHPDDVILYTRQLAKHLRAAGWFQ